MRNKTLHILKYECLILSLHDWELDQWNFQAVIDLHFGVRIGVKEVFAEIKTEVYKNVGAGAARLITTIAAHARCALCAQSKTITNGSRRGTANHNNSWACVVIKNNNKNGSWRGTANHNKSCACALCAQSKTITNGSWRGTTNNKTYCCCL